MRPNSFTHGSDCSGVERKLRRDHEPEDEDSGSVPGLVPSKRLDLLRFRSIVRKVEVIALTR